jgi:hypothetical protein
MTCVRTAGRGTKHSRFSDSQINGSLKVILSGQDDDSDYGDSQFGTKGSGNEMMLTGQGDDTSYGDT